MADISFWLPPLREQGLPPYTASPGEGPHEPGALRDERQAILDAEHAAGKTCPATYCPMEWPRTHDGSNPQLRATVRPGHIRAQSEKRAGWSVGGVVFRGEATPSSGYRTGAQWQSEMRPQDFLTAIQGSVESRLRFIPTPVPCQRTAILAPVNREGYLGSRIRVDLGSEQWQQNRPPLAQRQWLEKPTLPASAASVASTVRRWPK